MTYRYIYAEICYSEKSIVVEDKLERNFRIVVIFLIKLISLRII